MYVLTRRNDGCIIIYVNAIRTRKKLRKRKRGGTSLFQKNEFKAEVVRRNLTLENVANAIGIDAATLHRKMNGASDFYRSEIEKIIKCIRFPTHPRRPGMKRDMFFVELY